VKKKYSIGLDIGVASVGWAAMDEDYQIMKANGRYAMGTREFESAQTAESRRLQRGTRRRYNRRIKRIQLLQETLAPLFEDDEGFFIKSEETEKHYWRNHNQFENNSLSEILNSLNMNKHSYPTMYHLRHDLIQKSEKAPARLIYLALHNLVKFRGHFLNEGMNWAKDDGNSTLREKLEQYFELLSNEEHEMRTLSDSEYTEIIQLLEDPRMTKSDKYKTIGKVVGKAFEESIKLLVGAKSVVAKIFPMSDQLEEYKIDNLKIDLTDEKLEEVYEKLTDDEQQIVDKANIIFQDIMLQDILGRHQYVAAAKVNSYEQFAKDLKQLKEVYNHNLGEDLYRKTFITPKSKLTEYKETQKIEHLCLFDKFLKSFKQEEVFYKEIKKQLENIKESSNKSQALIQEILNRLETRQFLRKLKGSQNSAIPHQNNVYEAEQILKQQQTHYPEITDEMIEHVKAIISFRIPYYVGPLIKGDEENPRFGWAIRNKNTHIKPWNFDEVIDKANSAEAFITKMTSQCTYLLEETVLPKNSLIYEKYEVLNELNGIQIRPETEKPNKKYRLNQEQKEWIIENVFKKRKSVTLKQLKRDLEKSEEFKHLAMEGEIFGTQKEDRFATNLSTYQKMTEIFGEITEENESMIEEIIYWITVFEDKDILKIKIEEKYPNLSREQRKSLTSLVLTGWGRLSKRLLDEIPALPDGQDTILDVMTHEMLNFNEVLAVEKYDLKERITKLNSKQQEQSTKIKYADIKALHGSPAIKRGIWQAVQIVEELTDIFGEPENIMIEFAREEGKKTRTKSRKNLINEISKKIEKEDKELKEFLKEASKESESKFNTLRYYLYVTQGGKCLYSGERLEFAQLSDYEIDHILPRSFVKDDSLDNLALVKTKYNQDKRDEKMPLSVISNAAKYEQKKEWSRLRDYNLISSSKFNRLIKPEFTAQDKEGFFARQIVETRQITKHVRDLLQERFDETNIYNVNANLVSNLRSATNTTKIRDLNNKHHAVDAVLAIFPIQFIIQKYGGNLLEFNFKYQEAREKWTKMLTQSGKNFFLFDAIAKYDKFVHFQTGELLNGLEYLEMINDEMP